MCSDEIEIKKPNIVKFFNRFCNHPPVFQFMGLLIEKIKENKMKVDDCDEFFFSEQELVDRVCNVFMPNTSFPSFIWIWLKDSNFWNHEMRKKNDNVYARWNYEKGGCEVRLNISLFRWFWWLANQGYDVVAEKFHEELEKLKDIKNVNN